MSDLTPEALAEIEARDLRDSEDAAAVVREMTPAGASRFSEAHADRWRLLAALRAAWGERDAARAERDALRDEVRRLTARMAGRIGEIVTDEARKAPGGKGEYAAMWADKPHRLVYDLCGEVDRMRSRLADALGVLRYLEQVDLGDGCTFAGCPFCERVEGHADTCGLAAVLRADDGAPSESDRLRERLAEMESTLAPFATYASVYVDDAPDTAIVLRHVGARGTTTLTIGDFRAAMKAATTAKGAS